MRTVWGYAPRAIASAVTARLASGWGPKQAANLKGAVPFLEPPPARGTNIDQRETPREASNISGASSPEEELSELGRQIAVDLETDAYFDESGSGPGHGTSSYDAQSGGQFDTTHISKFLPICSTCPRFERHPWWCCDRRRRPWASRPPRGEVDLTARTEPAELDIVSVRSGAGAENAD
jgi:hypothetical protein